MNKQLKYAILAIALVQIFMIIGLLVLPPIAQALPGEFRVRLARLPLGETLLDIGVTPLPTALPAPSRAVAQSQIIIPTINTAAPNPGITATAPAVRSKTAPAIETIASDEPAPVPPSTATVTVTPTPIPLPEQARIEGMTIIAQGFNNCGPANLTINLDFYGNDTTQAEAAAFLKPNREDLNVSPWQMVDSEKEQQVFDILGSEILDETTMWQQTAQEAKVEIDADPQNAFTWFNLGTSLTRLGELTGEAEFYENGAAAFDQAFILGVPPRIVWYQFRPYIAYLKASRYQDMIDLANTILETQGGRNVEETYLYQGHALAFLGDGASAVEAYKLALKLNENFYPAQWALASITGGS